MWFGDLVTMKWWDDLWLNEAFASWAACWAAVGATRFTDSWASFLAAGKLEGYRVDLGPASHPIRGDVPDVSQAMANFDAISYQKGQAVLRQLSAYAGDDAFVEGLRAYFRDHAWGNTRLEDLTGAVGVACGEDLTGWQKDWLDRAGTDTLTLTGAPGGWRLRAEGPHGESAGPTGSTSAATRSTATPCATWATSRFGPRVRRPRSTCRPPTCAWSTTTTSRSRPLGPTRPRSS